MQPKFTLAATSDIHINKYPIEKGFFDAVNEHADLLLIGGDITDGEPGQVERFLDLVLGVTIPMVIILGNHDCSSDNERMIKNLLVKNRLIKFLDGEYAEYDLRGNKVGIAAVKGFGGGFAPHRIVGRGEKAFRMFIEEEAREVGKMQQALIVMQKASPEYRVALTHWAAFPETIEGEPRDLYPVLGSSLLGDAIELSKPHLALSGHAHHGPQGIRKARGFISACNIAYGVNNGKMLLFDFFAPEDVRLRHLEIQSDIS